MSLPIQGRGGPGLAVSRRTVLAGAVAAGAVALVGGGAMFGNAFAASLPPAGFLALSEFVTGKKLDATLAARYQAALARHQHGFAEAAAALQAFIATARPADVDALLALPALPAPLLQTLTQIVSAWYVGIVGDGEDVELISYAEALMYRPTHGALVIPTYGGGPDSWGDKPVVTPTEKAAT